MACGEIRAQARDCSIAVLRGQMLPLFQQTGVHSESSRSGLEIVFTPKDRIRWAYIAMPWDGPVENEDTETEAYYRNTWIIEHYVRIGT